MKQHYITLVLVIVIVIGGFYFFTREDSLQEPPQNDPTIDNGASWDERVKIARRSDGDAHTYTGVVSVPTPCHNISTDVLIAESYPEQVTLEIIVEEPAEDVICAQVISNKEFVVNFNASPEHTFRVLLDGSPIEVSVSTLPEGGTAPSSAEIELIQ